MQQTLFRGKPRSHQDQRSRRKAQCGPSLGTIARIEDRGLDSGGNHRDLFVRHAQGGDGLPERAAHRNHAARVVQSPAHLGAASPQMRNLVDIAAHGAHHHRNSGYLAQCHRGGSVGIQPGRQNHIRPKARHLGMDHGCHRQGVEHAVQKSCNPRDVEDARVKDGRPVLLHLHRRNLARRTGVPGREDRDDYAAVGNGTQGAQDSGVAWAEVGQKRRRTEAAEEEELHCRGSSAGLPATRIFGARPSKGRSEAYLTSMPNMTRLRRKLKKAGV